MVLQTRFRVVYAKRGNAIPFSTFERRVEKALRLPLRKIQRRAAELAPKHSGRLEKEILDKQNITIEVKRDVVRGFFEFPARSKYGLVQELGTRKIMSGGPGTPLGSKKPQAGFFSRSGKRPIPPLKELGFWAMEKFGIDPLNKENIKVLKLMQWKIAAEGIPSNLSYDSRFFLARAVDEAKKDVFRRTRHLISKNFKELLVFRLRQESGGSGGLSRPRGRGF